MAKKTNDNTIDLFYLDDENDNKKKTKRKSKSKNSNVPKKTVKQDNIIDLDNEIIIGLTPKPEKKQPKSPKKENVKPKQKKNSSKKPTTKQPKNQQQEQTKKQPKQEVIKNNPKKPKKNRIKFKILKWTGIFIILIALVVLFMLSPIFNVKQIKVEGLQKLLEEDIVNLSQIQLEENMFKIKISDVVKKIEENTYVGTATITRELPKTIKITIKEREPKYIIETTNGCAYIDRTGHVLEISGEKLELPVLIGYTTSNENIIDFQNTKKLSDEDCKKIEVINSIEEAAKNNDVLKYITSIDMTDIKNIILNLESEQKVAYLGDASNANLRILYLKKIIEEEAGKIGGIYINGDLHTMKPKPYFREKV